MNFKMMGRFLAQILSIEGIFMIPALLISLFCGETMAVQGFLWSIAAIAAVAGILLVSITRGSRTEIPGGMSSFHKGDTVVVVTNSGNVIHQLNEIFA